jgi:mandelate racemase
MAVPPLTMRTVELRSVSVPLTRAVVSKVGLFDRWPLILICVLIRGRRPQPQLP